jgi:hypothetical protein
MIVVYTCVTMLTWSGACEKQSNAIQTTCLIIPDLNPNCGLHSTNEVCLLLSSYIDLPSPLPRSMILRLIEAYDGSLSSLDTDFLPFVSRKGSEIFSLHGQSYEGYYLFLNITSLYPYPLCMSSNEYLICVEQFKIFDGLHNNLPARKFCARQFIAATTWWSLIGDLNQLPLTSQCRFIL